MKLKKQQQQQFIHMWNNSVSPQEQQDKWDQEYVKKTT